ncbi:MULTISPECIES: hypothetical protein [Actinomadura]|uniref:Uncharacterized protein n=1 Tax=Actinomadura litoris TaxID=2678616 RepID=A0A7K1L196_9ACTN|nr:MULTISPECIES: hypothetical protein [Actinomadura]MBT2206672.1 hypothetical protein [Actinomadura sp. NEAU-AAG7]MUN38228.1 hypothetical protein [Actinomadura litoris]
MSRDTHPGVRCPHCQSHLALVPVPLPTASTTPTVLPANPLPAGAPAPAPHAAAIKEEWSPPPVAEVLAVYAGRVKDTATAMRGAARVRESLNRARSVAAQRKAAQKAARHTPKSA